jgi:hypothetical protein
MKRLKIGSILAACALLVALAGCDILLAVPPGIAPPTQSVAIDTSLGYAEATWDLMGNGLVTVEFGDGARAEYKLRYDPLTTITHRYAYTGTYLVTIRQGPKAATASVTVTVDGPDVLVPGASYTKGPYVEEDERINFGMQRRSSGCAGNGSALEYTGIQPGAGTTWFRMFAYDDRGRHISLFDEQGEDVWGQWIEYATGHDEVQFLTCWAWWTDPEPPYPMIPKSTCPPGDGDDWEPPVIPGDAPKMTFILQARNDWIIADDLYPSVTWVVYVKLDSCS